ncbi:hypothetical protein BDR22DRAFT_974886 [Usnea florida]
MDSSNTSDQPFLPPPPGTVPNFTKPDTIGRTLTVTCSIFLVIMAAFVMVRIYTKIWIFRKATWDDLTCIIGFVGTLPIRLHDYSLTKTTKSSLPSLIMAYVLVGYLGYHSWDVTSGQVMSSEYFMIAYAQTLVAPLALGFIKASYFIFYRDLFWPNAQLRVAIWLGGILSTVFYILVFALNLYFATPRPGESFARHYLGPVSQTGGQLLIPSSAIGLVFDLYIITLPIWGIWQLQLPIRKKKRAFFVFLSGAFACVSATLTLNYRIELTKTDDVLRIVCPMSITTLVEMMIGVICTCAPSFNKFIQENSLRAENLQSYLGWNTSSSSRNRGYIRSGSVPDPEARIPRQGQGRTGDRGYELNGGGTFHHPIIGA